jgi:DNA-binding IclR family transcriptional regulator
MSTSRPEQILERLRAEYREMPGMRLKLEQVQRLCGIEQPLCKQALEALVEAKFLRLGPDGAYVLFGPQAS